MHVKLPKRRVMCVDSGVNRGQMGSEDKRGIG